MSDAIPRCSARIVLNLRSFCIDRFGLSGWEAALLRVGQSSRTLVRDLIPADWIPRSVLSEVLRGVDDAHGMGDFVLIVQAGRHEAETSRPALNRVRLRLPSTASAAEIASAVLSKDYDTGTFQEVSAQGPWTVLQLEGWGDPDLALCKWLLGYAWGALEGTFGPRARVEQTRCTAFGAPCCEFRVKYASDETGHEGPEHSVEGSQTSPYSLRPH